MNDYRVSSMIETEVEGCFEASSEVLSSKILWEARHFLEHGEYEMAFEGLILELILHNATPSDFKRSKWLEIAESLGLKMESVFVGDFWSRLIKWTGSRE